MSGRVAIVSPNYYPQTCGVGDHSMQVAKELLRRGVDVAVFTRGTAEPHPAALDVPVFGYPPGSATSVGRRILSGLLDWGATQLIVQYTAQMLDASRFGSLAIPLLVRRAKRRGLSVTVLAHELYNPWSWRPDVALGALAHRVLFLTLLAQADRFAVTTEARRRRIIGFAKLLRASRCIRVVRVGSGATPSKRSTRVGRADLGAFSTMTVGKRFDVLLEAFSLIAGRIPYARLTLIGDLGRVKHARYRALLQSIASHRFSDRIVLTGKIPLEEISTIVAGLDVFLHPDNIGASTRSSTLPLALGTGVPVVAVRGAETDSLFLNGENIVLARSLEPNAVAEATLSLLLDPVLAERVALGGSHLYHDHLSWPQIVSALVD